MGNGECTGTMTWEVCAGGGGGGGIIAWAAVDDGASGAALATSEGLTVTCTVSVLVTSCATGTATVTCTVRVVVTR